MALFTLPMWHFVSNLEGKGGFVVYSDNVPEYHPESDRAAYSGGGLVCDVPGPGQILEDFNTWQSQQEKAYYDGLQAQGTETRRQLQEGTYGRPPEPIRMVPGLNPVTGHFDTRPEREDERAARMVREDGDAAIRAGHITHDELTPDEVDKLSVEEFRVWRETHKDA
jgi:hypothetical protein